MSDPVRQVTIGASVDGNEATNHEPEVTDHQNFLHHYDITLTSHGMTVHHDVITGHRPLVIGGPIPEALSLPVEGRVVRRIEPSLPKLFYFASVYKVCKESNWLLAEKKNDITAVLET